MEVRGRIYTEAVLVPGKNPDTHWIGNWLRPRANLDLLERDKFLVLAGT
jgi:hypothetical protein